MNIKIGKKYRLNFTGTVVKIVSKTNDVGYGELPWDNYLFQDKDGNLFRENGEAMYRDGGHLPAHCLDLPNLVDIEGKI